MSRRIAVKFGERIMSEVEVPVADADQQVAAMRRQYWGASVSIDDMPLDVQPTFDGTDDDTAGSRVWDDDPPLVRVQVWLGEESIYTADDEAATIDAYATKIRRKFKGLTVTTGQKPGDGSYAPPLPTSKWLWPHTVK